MARTKSSGASSNRIYVGLDLSIRGTGVSILDKTGDLLDCFTIAVQNRHSNLRRYHDISKHIGKVVKDKDSKICVEGYAFGRARGGSASVFQLAELSGVIRYNLIYRDGIPPTNIALIAPTVVKAFATGKGNSAKSLILLGVYKRWGFEFKDDNQADAFTLSKISYHFFSGDRSGLNQKDKETMKKITEM